MYTGLIYIAVQYMNTAEYLTVPVQKSVLDTWQTVLEPQWVKILNENGKNEGLCKWGMCGSMHFMSICFIQHPGTRDDGSLPH